MNYTKNLYPVNGHSGYALDLFRSQSDTHFISIFYSIFMASPAKTWLLASQIKEYDGADQLWKKYLLAIILACSEIKIN